MPFYRHSCLDYQKMLCHLMQSKLLSIDAELEKDQCKSEELSHKKSRDMYSAIELFKDG